MVATGKSWKLEHSVAQATQGIVTSGYGGLTHGRALFLELPKGKGGQWLVDLQAVLPITAASDLGSGASLTRTAAMAFTCTGLQRMGLPDRGLASFSAPFREGMFQEDRLRRLGDKRKGEWLDTVVPDKPRWSSNTQVRGETEKKEPEEPFETPLTVHALLLLYAETEPEAEEIAKEVERLLASHDVKVVHRLPLFLDVEDKGFSREHFGFADGLSQPHPFDKDGAVRSASGDIRTPDPVQGVPLGDFLIGYENSHQEVAPGPVTPGDAAGPDGGKPSAAGLPEHEDALGFFDIGRNGSYLVVRELNQKVADFWHSMEKAARIIREKDPDADHVTALWLAERVVGRGRDGEVLRPEGKPGSTPGDHTDSGFLFYDDDHAGTGCPIGSHVRRAHPRDTLAPEPELKETLLNAANNHRILRRGRKYGPKLQDQSEDDGVDRGLLFMCLNTDIARQFEFIQQTWLLNKDFGTLFEEVDPLVGADGWMTIPQDTLRRRIHVQTFVQMAGGEYFFLPSLPALRYLGML